MARLVVTALTLALLAVPLLGTPASAAKPKCDGHRATIVGNNKANVLKGTSRRDVIVARGGNDTIIGRGGNDIICAGDGKDVIRGGAGRDRIFGGNRNDVLKGGAGKDLLNGGRGKDACYVNADGGTEVKCEEADLRVSVYAPQAWPGREGDNPFRILVQVKNIGAKPAAGVEVERTFGTVLVSCSAANSISGTEELGKLAPSQFEDHYWDVDCGAPQGPSGTVVMQAEATTTSTEENLANNEAASETKIES